MNRDLVVIYLSITVGWSACLLFEDHDPLHALLHLVVTMLVGVIVWLIARPLLGDR